MIILSYGMLLLCSTVETCIKFCYRQTKGMKEILSEKQKRSKIKRSKVSEEESNVDHG